MPVNHVYARGLIRRDLDLLRCGEKAASVAVNSLIRKQIAADPGSRFSPKRFARIARSIDGRMAPYPGTAYRATHQLASGQTYEVCIVAALTATTFDTETGTAAYDQTALGLKHIALTNERQGRHLSATQWGGSSYIEEHALRRYVERDVGENCSPAALAAITRFGVIHGSAFRRMLTAGLTPNAKIVVAPTRRGALVGHVGPGEAAEATRLVRDRRGVRDEYVINPKHTGLSVVWKTYLSHDLLRTDQMKAIEDLRAAQECLTPLASRWRAISGCPVPDMIDTADHDAILEGLDAYAATVRQHDWQALFPSLPTAWTSTRERIAGLEMAITLARAQTWPAEMVRRAAATAYMTTA